jgi:hypothetical protein
MVGEIDPDKIGPVAQRFMQIESDQNPPARELRLPGPLRDGPLSAGVGTKHNEMSLHAVTFLQEMVRGMTDTGDVLVQLLAQFQDTDLSSAASIEKLFSEPRFTTRDPGPGGGT